jgi:transcriptional regulator with XRE-family HTH domain
MGSASRARPQHLARKLLTIRERLGLSQTEIGKVLGLDQEFARNYVSGYERGTREPTLEVLLKYARTARISTDVLIDDKLELPKRFRAK